ncbi:MAG: alpha-2-macroglobulin [Deltaproteobacteria bacterium]|nr:alpha-2-macroglobulin [Deltaproteobacteria bacterium]
MKTRKPRRPLTLALLLSTLFPVVAFAKTPAPARAQAAVLARPADAKGTTIVPDHFLRRWDPVTIFFAKDTAPAGAGPEDKPERFVRLTPFHPGAFNWLDARTLQFKPAEPWPPLQRFRWNVDKMTTTLATLMAAPLSTVPSDGAIGLDTVDAITLTLPEPLDARDLSRMVTIELRPLPGIDATNARWLTRDDFKIKIMERQGRAEPAAYVLQLHTPIPLGTRAITHLRLSLDDDAHESFVDVSLATAEPFRITEVGCRVPSTGWSPQPPRRAYPVSVEGSHYSAQQAITCGSESRVILVDFSSQPKDLDVMAARNLVRITPAVDKLAFNTAGNTLQITGEFQPDTVYRVALTPTVIADQQGRPLDIRNQSEVHVYFPKKAAYLTLAAANGVLERHGPQLIPVNGRGHERVDLRVQRIDPLDRSLWPFPSQPVAFDESQRPPGPGEEPQPWTDLEPVPVNALQRQIAALGSPPVSAIVNLPLQRDGNAASFGLDLTPQLARIAGREAPGHYLVGVRKLDRSNERAWMRLQITDLSLSTAEEPLAVRFAVTSLSTGKAVAGAKIEIQGSFDKQWVTLAEGTTGTDGTFLWSAPGKNLRHNETVRRIVVKKDDDVLVLDPTHPPDEYADNHWAGSQDRWLQWAFEPLATRGEHVQDLCHIFTERPVYRPEDEVHIKGYTRQRYKGTLRPSTFPADVIVQGPGGEDQVWTLPIAITERGSFYAKFAEANLPTGEFQAFLQPQHGERCGPVKFRMEAYRIPDFEIQLHSPDRVPLDREFDVKLTASYYAGGKVAGRPLRWRVTQFPYVWTPKARAGFFFSSDARYSGNGKFESTPALEKEDSTSPDGDGSLSINPAIESTAQPRRYIVEATITGADDQTVTNTKQVLALPPFVLGLKVPRYLEKVKSIQPEVIVVGPDGETLPDVEVTLRLLNRQWHSHLRASDFSDGSARYVTDIVDEKVSETTITSRKEPTSVTLPISEAGVYVVQLEARDKLKRTQVVGVDLYAGGEQPVTWAKPATRVFEVVSDKDAYDPGEIATLVLKSPYQEARALAVIEAPEGNHYEWIDVTGGSASYKVDVRNTYVPRLPVHFILMRGRVAAEAGSAQAKLDLGKPATLAATAWVKVNALDNRVEVKLEHAEKARPGDKVPVTLHVSDPHGKPLPAEVTLWLVDQAVLALGKEQRLDPVPDFITDTTTRLAVRDTRSMPFGLLPFAEQPGGSGGEGEEAKPFDKATVRRTFKSVPYYNPAIMVGPDGIATVTIDLPDNLTNFKLRAKAISGLDRFGYAMGDLSVRLPLVVQAAVPRFVRPNDTFTAAAIGRIVEGEGGPGRTGVFVDGAKIGGPAQHDVVWVPDQPDRFEFPVEVTTPPYTADGKLSLDAVTFKVAAERLSDAVSDAVEVKIPIRDDRQPQRSRTLMDLKAGTNAAIPAVSEAARPGTVRRTVLVSDQPGLVRMAAGLDFLLRYPYGCTEQRLSLARTYVAMKEFRALLHEEDAQAKTDKAVKDFLQWLPRVVDDQGLCSYWPGSHGYVSLTAWVVQFLVEAKAAGYPVEQPLLDKLLASLDQALRSDYSRFIDGEAFAERAWALRALSSAGKSNAAYAAELARRSQFLDLESTALVALALSSSGDSGSSTLNDLEQKLWNGIIFRLYQGKETYGGLQKQSLWRSGLILPSETRTVAEVTNTIGRMHGDAPRLPVLINALVTLGRDNGWGSTNTNAAALMALSGVLKAPFAGSTPHRVQTRFGSDAKAVDIGPDAPIVQVSSTSSDAGSVAVEGNEQTSPVIVRAETSYLPLADGSQVAPEAQGFVVTREWLRLRKGADEPPERVALTAAGSSGRFGVGDIIEEHVQIVTPDERHYVAIVAPLAAGVEPLNANLATASSEAKTINQLTVEPTYMQSLDDHIAYYYDVLPKGTYDFYFRTRATTAGTFIQPAATAEMMYDETVHGRSAGARMSIDR